MRQKPETCQIYHKAGFLGSCNVRNKGVQRKVGPGVYGHGLMGDMGSRGMVGPDNLEGLFQLNDCMIL